MAGCWLTGALACLVPMTYVCPTTAFIVFTALRLHTFCGKTLRHHISNCNWAANKRGAEAIAIEDTYAIDRCRVVERKPCLVLGTTWLLCTCYSIVVDYSDQALSDSTGVFTVGWHRI